MSGLPINEEDDEFGNERKTYIAPQIFGRTGSEFLEKSSNVEENESLPEDLPDYIFKCKSVFKCKICPRVVCLNEDTMSAHLKSKVRHVVCSLARMLQTLVPFFFNFYICFRNSNSYLLNDSTILTRNFHLMICCKTYTFQFKAVVSNARDLTFREIKSRESNN